ncbi:MAG: FliM/FliN family flagellar motor switch protein [Legionellales bacterium]
MSSNIKKVALAEQLTEQDDQVLQTDYLSLVGTIEVQCSIRLGTVRLTIDELRQLKSGQALHLQQQTNAPIEVILNEKIIARGELMSYEDKFALQLTEVAL